MMHSSKVEFEGEDYAYMVNGDYSGDIHILVPDALVERVSTAQGLYQRVTLPFEVIEEIVGRKAADALVAYFENATGIETLKFLTSLP